jgi:hypothetical protein
VPKMIFHHPLPIEVAGASGSRVRAAAMLAAFRELGYDVLDASGYSAQRRAALHKLRQELRQGARFDFLYAESSTTPSALADPHHLPLAPWLDASFFTTVRQADIPSGLFLRDLHYVFDIYPPRFPGWKKRMLEAFHAHDLRWYRRGIDHLFLPQEEMASALPGGWPAERLSALPPGCTPLANSPELEPELNGKLHLLYVGGVVPPLYDLTGLFAALRGLEHVRLTLCCRPAEWESQRGRLGAFNPRQVRVVHQSGPALAKLAATAHVFALAIGEHPYLQLTVPVKVTEALGWALPLACLGDTAGSRFAVQHGLGWLAGGVEEYRELLVKLHADQTQVRVMRRQVLERREQHTWLTRAQQAAAVLAALDQR